MGARSRQSGQATVEWVGLLLAVGLALGALAGGVRGAVRGDSGEGARELGEAVAERITCAARDRCGAGERGAPPTPPATRPQAPAKRPQAPSRERAAAPFPRVGPVSSVAERAWIVCFGYRSLRDDLEHPRTPREARPLDRTLDIANDCLNPWEFFFGG
jgi:hypothetical protein